MKFDNTATFGDDTRGECEAWREDPTHIMVQAGDGTDHGRANLTFDEARRFAEQLLALVNECERYPA